MRKQRVWRFGRFLLLAAVIAGMSAPAAFAESLKSSNYQATETQFGAGSTQQQCSSQYCTRTSIGDMAVGDSESSQNTASFGPITPEEPMLEVIVDPGVSNLGVLTTEHTATKTTTVQVRNYLSNGYVLQITGSPPKYGNHALASPSSPTASTPGTEQFGINATDNSTPDIGAAAVQVPSGQFSFGVVDAAYSTPNLFKYVSGDTVARSPSSSGRTDYTISMIVNISNATPAGHYSGDFAAVVIPVY